MTTPAAMKGNVSRAAINNASGLVGSRTGVSLTKRVRLIGIRALAATAAQASEVATRSGATQSRRTATRLPAAPEPSIATPSTM